MPLNPSQQAAVDHGDGPLLIDACPGAGKTSTLTQRVASLVARGVQPHRLLLVTFTNKAATEMRSRIAKIVSSDKAKRIWAGTFHSVCVRLLRSFEGDVYRDGRKSSFSIYDESDSLGCVKAAVDELELDRKQHKPEDYQSRISKFKSQGLVWQDVPETDELETIGKRVWQRYEEILLHNQAFDFDDLLNVVLRRAEASDELGVALRNKWSHVLCDEAQDMNDVQSRMVKAFASSTRNVTAVGDFFQSVYGFRGANPQHIKNFATESYPDAKVIQLSDNYRSTQSIVACFNSLVDGAHARSNSEVGSKVLIKSFPDETAEARFVVAGIMDRIAKGTTPSECVVIYRVHALSRAIEEGLRHQGIRYQVVGGMNFYDRKVVKDSMAYLRVIANPDSDLDFERIVNEPCRGLGERAVAKIRERARAGGKSLSAGVADALAADIITGKAQEGLRNFFYMHKQAKEILADGQAGSISRMTNHILSASGYRAALEVKRKKCEEKRKAAEAEKVAQDQHNLEQVVAAVDAYERRVDKPTLEGFIEEVALISAQDELKGDKVSLMTAHACKGLEMDAVWGIGFEAGMLPFAMAETPAEIEEESRIAYVMCSRARKWLSLSYCEERMRYGKTLPAGPSAFLDRIPEGCSIWTERDAKLDEEGAGR